MPLRYMAGSSASTNQAPRPMPTRQPMRETASVEASNEPARPAAPQEQPNTQEAYRFNNLDIPAFLRKRS